MQNHSLIIGQQAANQTAFFCQLLQSYYMNSEIPDKISNFQELLKLHYANSLKNIYDVTYICECGKKYQSYSALYLHARTKHKVKLLAAVSEDSCSIKVDGKKCQITYFLWKKIKNQEPQVKINFEPTKRFLRSHSKVQRNSKDQSSWQQQKQNDCIYFVLQKFFLQHSNRGYFKDKRVLLKVLETLKKFIIYQIKGLFEEVSSQTDNQILLMTSSYNLPTYFNKFICEIPTKYAYLMEIELQTIVEILLNLGEWMRQQRLTQFSLQRNENFKF